MARAARAVVPKHIPLGARITGSDWREGGLTPDDAVIIDEFGRIAVQFHWDRLGPWSDKSSIRIRVAQGSAGKRWGR